jgi:hypothetical protein
MRDPQPQSYENHARRLPRSYLATAVAAGLALLLAIAELVRHPDLARAILLLLACALFGTLWYARTNALVVQDRVIRLEERLRCERLLPPDLRGRISELTVPQLVALRFASDEELPELARQVLEEGLTDRRTIKKRIRAWRGDHLRV